MALIAWSSEMSFSLSRLFSTLRSMSIWFLRLRQFREPPELHLDRARPEHVIREAAVDTLGVQDHPFVIGLHDPAGQRLPMGLPMGLPVGVPTGDPNRVQA